MAGNSQAVMILQAGQVQFTFPRPAILMGIVNITPDSFSDGGRFLEPSAAVERALQLVEEGAEIIDLGGESTRPNAVPISEAEELRRVMPVLEKLTGRVKTLLSIDTYKPGVAQAAVQTGAGMINDIGANREDPAMWRVAAESGAAYVIMHMQGTPQTMQLNPTYGNVCPEVGSFFEDRMKRVVAAGVSSKQLVLDVGIGFGKKREHNLALLGGLEAYGQLRRPMLLGVSRKSLLSVRTGGGVEERLPAALAVACAAVRSGVQIIRTHDVRPTLLAIRMAEEILVIERAQA
jgi:dihydropteroate synthase